ncbi:hypothetical protein CA85_45130 [Allorhodopirellula solitaria]|uniref:Uncharacterized protein n=1 Tax=Allorhodopirellula solitaria TaxID=2527987 RepID=A0A5C5X1K0_9BACT|nr:hypothetical protein CA85_45130 [Allorhodopirellula solitaria]
MDRVTALADLRQTTFSTVAVEANDVAKCVKLVRKFSGSSDGSVRGAQGEGFSRHGSRIQ